MSKARRRALFDAIREEIEEAEELMYELSERLHLSPSWDTSSRTLKPLTNVYDSPEEIIVTADVPYACPDKIRVDAVSKGEIELRVEMNREVRFEDLGLMHRKGEFSGFMTRVEIPHPVDHRRIRLNCRRGLLVIRMPKKGQD